jgi:hypothetical protein
LIGKKPNKPKEDSKSEEKEFPLTSEEIEMKTGILPEDIDFRRGMGCG